MTPEEQRDQAIQGISEQLRIRPFSVEFKVVKKPKGITVTFEVTQKEMDEIVKQTTKNAHPILK